MNYNLKYKVEQPYARNLIAARGIVDIDGFLNPKKENLESPFLLDNITKAVKKTVELNEVKTLVVVDSDCDGYNSSSILIDYLQEVYPNWSFDFFIHSKKQHGLEDVVTELDLNEYELVYLPDAGSNDDEYFNMYPKTTFIILDHHIRTNNTPVPTNAIIVNNQESAAYLNKALCGAGVTWQFCRAMDELEGYSFANKYIDQAAIAIIGDVMDITTPENAYIIKEGLNSIHNTFIRLLCNNAAYSLGNELTPIGIAFYIVPMVNSMCRMGTLDEKTRMFQAFTWPQLQVECHKRGVAKGTMIDVSIESVRECTNAKSRQKREQAKMAELCDKKIIEDDLLSNKIITIILDETFDKIPSELNGLAATTLSNKYNHPVYILRANKEGELKGSGRGLDTLDMPPLKDFMESSGLVEWVQGHQNAHGACIKTKNLEKFLEWSNNALKDVNMGSKTWQVDFSLSANDTSLRELVMDMDKLSGYWGQGFPEPLIAVNNITAPRSSIQVMGKLSDTVKITYNGVAYMFFKRSLEEVKELTQYAHARLTVVGKANLNYYNGIFTPQIFVDDYTIEDDILAF